MKTQIPNINMVRSAWRRVKKNIKDAIIRDLKPAKDVKGGGGVTGESKPTTGEGSTAHQTRPLIRIKSHHRSVREILIQIRHRSSFGWVPIWSAVVRQAERGRQCS